MSIRDINMKVLDLLEDICIETEKLPNKNDYLKNKLNEAFEILLETRKLEIFRAPPKNFL